MIWKPYITVLDKVTSSFLLLNRNWYGHIQFHLVISLITHNLITHTCNHYCICRNGFGMAAIGLWESLPLSSEESFSLCWVDIRSFALLILLTIMLSNCDSLPFNNCCLCLCWISLLNLQSERGYCFIIGAIVLPWLSDFSVLGLMDGAYDNFS